MNTGRQHHAYLDVFDDYLYAIDILLVVSVNCTMCIHAERQFTKISNRSKWDSDKKHRFSQLPNTQNANAHINDVLGHCEGNFVAGRTRCFPVVSARKSRMAT